MIDEEMQVIDIDPKYTFFEETNYENKKNILIMFYLANTEFEGKSRDEKIYFHITFNKLFRFLNIPETEKPTVIEESKLFNQLTFLEMLTNNEKDELKTFFCMWLSGKAELGTSEKKLILNEIQVCDCRKRTMLKNIFFTCGFPLTGLDSLHLVINTKSTINMKFDDILTKVKKSRNDSVVESVESIVSDDEYLLFKRLSFEEINNFSLRTFILVSGFTSEDCDHHAEWAGLTSKFSSTNNPNFVYLSWPSETISSTAYNVLLNATEADLETIIEKNFFSKTKKLNAKKAGQFLAAMIASKQIFLGESITLIGFSLGTHVIKSCLKELHFLSNFDSSLQYIVKDVVLLGGATRMKNKEAWKNIIETCVNGKVWVAKSEGDFIVGKVYKSIMGHTAIGTDGLMIPECEKIINQEVGYFHIRYRKNLSSIVDLFDLTNNL